MPAPQQTPQQQQGTGFTNLKSWLDAGKGRDKSITEAGTDRINKEKGAFSAAAKPVEDASYTANNYWDGWTAGSAVSHAANGGGTADIERDLTQSYTGPKEIKYDPAAQKNLWDVNSLSSADTAGQVLGRDEMDKGQYSQGAQALDRVLFGADAESQKAIGGVKDASKAFGAEVASRSTALKDKVAGFEKAAADANAGNRAKLKDYGKSMSDKLDARVLGAKEQQDKIRKMLEDDPTLLYPGNQGPTRDDPFQTLQGGEIREITGGGEISRGTMVNDDEVKGFDVLAKVLGLDAPPTVQKTGTYQELGTKVTKDPNYVAPLKDLGNPRPGTITSMLDGDINDPNTPKGAYQKAFLEYGPGARGGMYSDEENRQFLDRFRRENPQFADLIPDQAAVEAWEKSPEYQKQYEGQLNKSPDGPGVNWQSTPEGANKVKADSDALLEEVKKRMPWMFGG